jgi:hypothetical protein
MPGAQRADIEEERVIATLAAPDQTGGGVIGKVAFRPLRGPAGLDRCLQRVGR